MAGDVRRALPAHAEAAAGQPLWWPPAKLAGRYLAPYLARAIHGEDSAGQLVDLAGPDDDLAAEEEHDASNVRHARLAALQPPTPTVRVAAP